MIPIKNNDKIMNDINNNTNNTSTHTDIHHMSGSSLAFVGDAVFALYVRQRVAMQYDKKSGGLHALTSRYVSARSQAVMADAILPCLDEAEQDIFARCKNAHVDNKTKAASFKEYKKATGLEGVLGYLYLMGNHERLGELCEMCFETIHNA